jgi:hypothetical protein
VSLEGPLAEIIGSLRALQDEHRLIAATAQASRSRTASVEVTLKKIQALSAKQDDLLREAAAAAAHGLYRSAHVAAFAALADALADRVDRLGLLAAVASKRPKWTLASVDDLQEYSDFQVGEVCREAGAITRAQLKTFHGLLHRRNQCAHPTGYQPDLDQTLGFLSETVSLLGALMK